MLRKRIAIDFDNTIVEKPKHGLTTIYGRFGKLIPGAKETINELYADGYTIYIFTARQETDLVADFLTENRIYFNRIFNKPEADVYIDDRSITFEGNWLETKVAIDYFVPWEKHD